ncbi:hypothetical protein U1769_25385, partial [Sphingomonas sp. ZT3P38]|uniref:hypothetical protein n=1 Tax=Parasphingomonas zepuensis TaxID=3096161 RepID=UPI002FC9F338
MIRVGFPFMDRSSAWMGGINYLRNLIQAILADPERVIEPVLIVPVDMPEEAIAHFGDLDVQVIRCPLLGSRSATAMTGTVLKRLIGRDIVMERWLARNRIAVLSHLTTLGRRSKIPSIGWIPDFQHLRLPELFTEAMRRTRDRAFRRIADQATVMIVSSNDALGDLKDFMPDAVARTHVLPFVADVSDEDVASRAELEQAFDFTGPYFFIPNQFWPHKNHALVIESLALMQKTGSAPLVLSTGSAKSFHDPGLYGRLIQRAADLGVASRFR